MVYVLLLPYYVKSSYFYFNNQTSLCQLISGYFNLFFEQLLAIDKFIGTVLVSIFMFYILVTKQSRISELFLYKVIVLHKSILFAKIHFLILFSSVRIDHSSWNFFIWLEIWQVICISVGSKFSKGEIRTIFVYICVLDILYIPTRRPTI